MDPHDPLKIMRLYPGGHFGLVPEPMVGVLPEVLIGSAIVTGVGFLFFGDFVWKYAPLFGWAGWTPTLKLLVCMALGYALTELLTHTYESNHRWMHGSREAQIKAIRE